MKQPFNIDPSATAAFSALAECDASEVPPILQGPFKAVVIGGGTGAPVSIRTLLSLGIDTSAVVAMADDGGSTGILREKADVTPPGDIRKCLTAFAGDPSDPLVRAFKYRLRIADDHALGNLMLAALEDACGSFPEAIALCERLLDAQGHVYPSTLAHVTLSALTRDGRRLNGQAAACHSKTALEQVSLVGPDTEIPPFDPALRAIEEAALHVLGPGSRFTSIIPYLHVPGVTDAIRRSRGSSVFVCSLADVQGETWGLTALEHVRSLMEHGMEGLLDYVLLHTTRPLEPPKAASGTFAAAAGVAYQAEEDLVGANFPDEVRPVRATFQDVQDIQALGPLVVARNLADAAHPTWHAPAALRDALLQVIRLISIRKEL